MSRAEKLIGEVTMFVVLGAFFVLVQASVDAVIVTCAMVLSMKISDLGDRLSEQIKQLRGTEARGEQTHGDDQ